MCNRSIPALGACLMVLTLATALWAQRKEPLPEELVGVEVTEYLDTQLPLELEFVDQHGNHVQLGDYFQGDLPVILTMNYSNCPMLCSLQLNGLFDGLKGIKDWNLGQKYQMLTVSIDPMESTERSAMTRQKYLTVYGREGAGEGYACLTGARKRSNSWPTRWGLGTATIRGPVSTRTRR